MPHGSAERADLTTEGWGHPKYQRSRRPGAHARPFSWNCRRRIFPGLLLARRGRRRLNARPTTGPELQMAGGERRLGARPPADDLVLCPRRSRSGGQARGGGPASPAGASSRTDCTALEMTILQRSLVVFYGAGVRARKANRKGAGRQERFSHAALERGLAA
jgi:hypothetical protein